MERRDGERRELSWWRRRAISYFVVLYLFVQVVVPALGLYAAYEHDRTMPFAWQMFSRVPESADE